MTIVRKPKPDPEKFIQSADFSDKDGLPPEDPETPEGENAAVEPAPASVPGKRASGKQAKRKTAKTESRKNGKPEEKVKMTFYMPKPMHAQWKMYEATQLVQGNKVSFQGEVMDFIQNTLKKAKIT